MDEESLFSIPTRDDGELFEAFIAPDLASATCIKVFSSWLTKLLTVLTNTGTNS